MYLCAQKDEVWEGIDTTAGHNRILGGGEDKRALVRDFKNYPEVRMIRLIFSDLYSVKSKFAWV
jgi:hypothetical protein